MRIPQFVRQIRHRPSDVFKAVLLLGFLGPLMIGGSAAIAFFVVPIPAVVPEPTAGSQAQTSFVYAADGSLIATFHSEFNRELIDLSKMPKHLQHAAIASEDARFYRHGGLDVKSISRALAADIRARDTVQGGSTITQQFVKNSYIESPKRNVLRKVREALISAQVERTFTKNKILENYLNTVYLGKGSYGVEAAAKTYFNKHASQLTLSESALLVGVIPAPARYSPFDDPPGAEARRLQVIGRMEKVGFIDALPAQAARDDRPVLAAPRQEVLRYPWFVDALQRSIVQSPKFGKTRAEREAKLFGGGLRITTTLDPKSQETAERTLATTLDKPRDPYASLVAIDPRTGYVRALVGGRDYREEKFNIAVQGHRQPGSAFKPFVMVTALEEGKPPSTTYNAPGKYCKLVGYKSKDGCVHNYGNAGFGTITMEKATANSVNTYYIQLARDLGMDKVFDVAKRMGISETSVRRDRETKNLAAALGGFTTGVTPLEMASAYATLGAGGIYREPKFYSVVKDGFGRVIEGGPSESVQALDSNVAANATKLLTRVIISGTAKKANIGRPAAGKTGTAQGFTDAWFVGYTPDLATAVWMGHRKATLSMTSVNGVRNVTGGTIPAAMWATFMKAALADIAASEFDVPGKITQRSERGFRLPPPTGGRPTPSPSPSPSPEPSPSPAASPKSSPSPTGRPGPIISILP